MSTPPKSTPPKEPVLPHVISEPTPPPGWQPPEMPPPWLREALHIESPPENVRRPPIVICPAWGCGPPPTIPLPPSTINEILKEVKEAEKHGEMPIAVGSGGVIAVPKPTSTEVKPPTEQKPSTEHEKLKLGPIHTPPPPAEHEKPEKLGLKRTPQEEKQSSPQHLWVGWRVGPEMEKYVKEFIEAFRHGRHIQLPPMGGVLTPIPGAPAPGAPVVIMQSQGTGNQQSIATGSP